MSDDIVVRLALNFHYDIARDVITIEGQQYSGELFRDWATGGLDDGQLFKMIRNPDGSFAIGKIGTPTKDNTL